MAIRTRMPTYMKEAPPVIEWEGKLSQLKSILHLTYPSSRERPPTQQASCSMQMTWNQSPHSETALLVFCPSWPLTVASCQSSYSRKCFSSSKQYHHTTPNCVASIKCLQRLGRTPHWQPSPDSELHFVIWALQVPCSCSWCPHMQSFYPLPTVSLEVRHHPCVLPWEQVVYSIFSQKSAQIISPVFFLHACQPLQMHSRQGDAGPSSSTQPNFHSQIML